jgi:uncharacterized membrane protein YhaH (DUF805 family)
MIRQAARAPSRPDTTGLAWNWTAAGLGAAYALLGAGLMLGDVRRGLAACVGVLPAAIVGLPPTRRGRVAIGAVGVLVGLSMFTGGLLSEVPILAVAAIAALGPASALLAARWSAGRLAMTLALPLVGIGLSYSELGEAAAVAVLMVAGTLYAMLISLLWPERPRAARGPAPAAPTLGYGVRLGAAGATAAAIGFALDLEHVGWACAAALLVMRPSAEMQRLRSVGRIAAVAGGALAAIAFVRLGPPPAWYSLVAIAALTGAAGTHASRWYVTPAFTTFLVFLLLLYADPDSAGSRFGERVSETLLGVGLAYAFGLALPTLAQRLRARGT